MNIQRILVVAQKEWREILRDRIYFSLAFLLPLVLMVVFGYGMTQEVQNVPLAVVDYDRSELSRDYARRYIESRYFDFKGYLRSTNEAEALLVDGRVRVVIVLPEYFQERIFSGQAAAIQTLVDGTFTFRLRTVDGYVQAINAAATAELQAGYLTRRLGISLRRAETLLQPVKLEVRYLYNEELRENWSVAPALIMFILTIAAPLLMAMSVVREKETGTIYNIYASTISRAEYLTGKLLPNVAVSFANGVILIALATYYFGAPLKGSIIFFLFAMLIFVIAMSAVGLLISLMVRTQIAALMITVVLGFILAFQFAGMLTPVASMTGANYLIAHAMAPKYFNDVVTNTFLKGGGLLASWREIGVLAAFVVGFLTAGYLLFRKRDKV